MSDVTLSRAIARPDEAGQRAGAVDRTERTVARPRSPFGTVLRGAMALVSTQPITWAAGLLTTMFVPRYLGAHDLGQLAVVTMIAGLAGTILSLGITTSLVRRVAAQPEQVAADMTGALALLLGLSIPSAIGLSLAGPLVGLSQDGDPILMIALAGMVVSLVQTTLSAVLVGQERHARFAWLNAACVVASSVAGVGALAAGGSLSVYMAVGVVAVTVATVVGWQMAGLGLDRAGLAASRLWSLACEGLPFLGWTLTTRLRGDILIALLSTFLGHQVVGLWGAAGRIISAPLFVPTLIVTPLLPALSQCADNRATFNETLRRSLILMLILTVPACAFVVALAATIPDLLGWQAEFQASVPLMILLSLNIPLIAVGMVLGMGLIALGSERPWLAVNVMATVATVAGTATAVPLLEAWNQQGVIGAAAAVFLTEVIMIVGAMVLLPRGTLDWLTVSISARVAVAGVCLAVVTLWLSSVSVPLAVVAGGAVYVVVLFGLRAVRPSDLRTGQSMMVTLLKRAPAV